MDIDPGELESLLQKLNWSQVDLANHVGVHATTVWRWMKKPPLLLMLYLRLLASAKKPKRGG